MTTYTVAYGGERLDRIAKKTMQTERDGTVEAILNANPGLAAKMDKGLVPAGTVILIPDDYQVEASATFVLPWE